MYNPTQNVAAMIKFQGQSSLKHYMPMKPIKRGIKVWVLADSANGYFHKFDIYTGKQKKRQVGFGEYVVKTLTDGLKKKNHHVFFDNFFTSPKLLEDMEKDGIYGCGVGLPPGLKKHGLKKRYYCACVCMCMLLRVCVCGVCVCVCVVCGVCDCAN